MTESVFAVGRGSVLVGRSSYCDYPPEASSVEVVGGFADPNLERILALRPSLVCGERGPAGPELAAALERHGIKTYFPPIDRVADVAKAIAGIAELVDAAAEGQRVASELDAKIERIRSAAASGARAKVVMLFDWRPLVAAGPESFPDDVIAIAGGENPVTSGGKYPKLSPEGLLSLDPDWILDGSAGAYTESPQELARSIPGLEALRAAKSGALHRLEGTAALRSGPRLADGVEQVARVLHPDRFAARP